MELVEAYIARIEEVNPYLNAIVVKNYDQALAQARQADALLDGYDIGDDGEASSSWLFICFEQRYCNPCRNSNPGDR